MEIIAGRGGGLIADGGVVGSRPALREPEDFGCHRCSGFESLREAVADMGGPANAREEEGLQEARNAEPGGDEDDAKGWIWAYEQVLYIWSQGRLSW